MKMNFTLPSVFFLLTICFNYLKDVVSCGANYTCNPANPTRCYQVVTSTQKYSAAGSYCDADNARLVLVESATTNSFVQMLMEYSNSDEFYLGLDDIQHEGSFEWTVTGAPATWTNWNGSSGNNVGIDCVHAFRSASWRWKAVTCNKKNSFICDCSDPANLGYSSPSAPSDSFSEIVSDNIGSNQWLSSEYTQPTVVTDSMQLTVLYSSNQEMMASSTQNMASDCTATMSSNDAHIVTSTEQTTDISETQQTTDILEVTPTVVQYSTNQTIYTIQETPTMIPHSVQNATGTMMESSVVTDVIYPSTTFLLETVATTPTYVHETTDSILIYTALTSASRLSSPISQYTEFTETTTESVAPEVSTIAPKNCTNCKCSPVKNGVFDDHSFEEVLLHLQDMMTATVQKKKASKRRSVSDSRTSSSVIGSGAVGIVTTLLLFVIGTDLSNMFAMIHSMTHTFRKTSTVSTYDGSVC